MRTTGAPTCSLCGSTGWSLYSGLQDQLFGARGSWGLARCNNPACGLLWMNPMPVAEDLGEAYAGYYTHTVQPAPAPPGRLKAAYHAVKRAYLARRFGYPSSQPPWLQAALAPWLYLLPLHRSSVDEEVRCLPARPGARLLDVGCGSGLWLQAMRERGWHVAGVDFDAGAVAAARRQGLDVSCGSLQDQHYLARQFDAITLNHVIEHVPDPEATLQECLRLLKPEGRLVLYTPNSASLGHKVFGRDWRGLEPPRHLHLFSVPSMQALVARAGFTRFEVRTVNSSYIFLESMRLRVNRQAAGRRSPWLARLSCKALALCEQATLLFRPDLGECLAVTAVKPA